MDLGEFDYRTASSEQIEGRALLLEGRTLGDIPGVSFAATTGSTGRGEVGAAVERFFGIPANSLQAADFPGAEIELKVVPLVRVGSTLRTKERTVLSMVDYPSIIDETWSTAKLRSKLHILFVFFEHLPDRPKATFPIRKVVLWKPEGDVERFIRADWQAVRKKVLLGQAHLLSESDGRLMGPCTKAIDSTKRRRQPRSAVLAKPRAFALKPALTKSVFQDALQPGRAKESLLANLRVQEISRFEQAVSKHFERYVGCTVAEAGDMLAVPRSQSKSYAAMVVRMALGAQTFRRPIYEFERMGLTPRIVRCDPDLRPYESTSFPAFRYLSLLEEQWDDSDLLSRIEYMLFVPAVGARKATPTPSCRLHKAVFWRPSAETLETAKQEWEAFRQEIRSGKAKHLTPASQTKVIHVRPHGRDGSDTDLAPVVGQVVKKSFWLNRAFVQRVLTNTV